MADALILEFKAKTDDLDKRLKGIEKSVEDTGKASKKVTADMGAQFKNLGTQIATAFGVTMGIAAFVKVIKGAITTTKEFEAQMSKVRAISGATASEMDKLEKSAKRLGASTIFTATQVGQLQEEYARLGFTTKEILAATEATLDLAAATGETLAASAQVAGQTVRGFGLDASETTRVADVMALSFSKSALNLSDFTEGMKMVAPIARAANIPLETATALLGRLADAGLRGSMAGTALRNLLSKLADANSDLSKELGYSVKNTDDLFRAFQDLAKGNIDLTQATELTDERSKAAFITLINGIDSVESLKTALDGAAGSAKAMADIMQDNFQGATIALTSAWEGFLLSVTNTQALEDATRAVTRFLQSMTGDIEASNAAFNDARAEVLQYREELMGLSGLSIVKAIGDQRDALADAENALIDLRKSRKDYATGQDFLDAIKAQELRVDTLRSKFDAARKALQDFRDRQTELGGELAPTADEVERLSQALAEIEASVTPPVRSIALLNTELKALKDELTNAEIGSEGFWNVLFRIQTKIKELSDAQAMVNLAEDLTPDVDDTSSQDAKIQAEAKRESDRYKALQKQREDHIAYLDKATKDELAAELEKINAIEQAEKAARDKKIQDEEDMRHYSVQLMTEALSSIANIYGSINQMAQQSADWELAMWRKKLDEGLITREEFDAKERKLQADSAQRAKDAATFNAVIGAAQAAINALASPGVPFPVALAFALMAAATAAVQVAAIQSAQVPQFATGVIGLQGAGTETSDSIHARLSRGESVMTAKETRQYRPILEAIRKGSLERLIAETYVRPAVDSAMLSGFADMGRSADLNGLTAKLSDHNIIAAMDRNRSATVYGLKMLADEIKANKRRGDRNTWH